MPSKRVSNAEKQSQRLPARKQSKPVEQQYLDQGAMGWHVLAADSRLQHITLPERWQDHPLVKNEFFYTLPLELLSELKKHVGRKWFDGELWELECDLSRLSSDIHPTVGFFSGQPVKFCYLRDNPLTALEHQYIRTITTAADPDEVLALLGNRLHSSQRNLRAYAGWLLSTPQFLSEHLQIWRAIATVVAASGMPTPVPPLTNRAAEDLCFAKVLDGQVNGAIIELRDFCARWRLSMLVGPLLPHPIATQVPASSPIVSGHQAESSGYGLVAFPDTVPLPSETELREVLGEAIRMQRPDHLREWFNIIDDSNKGKNTLIRFARLFEVQHIVRLLLTRHPAAFHRRRCHLQTALAAYFNISTDSIRRDLQLLDQRLGRQWHMRYPQPSLCTP